MSCYLPVREKSSTSHSARFPRLIVTEARLLTRYESVGFDELTGEQDRAGRGRLKRFSRVYHRNLVTTPQLQQKHTVSSVDCQALYAQLIWFNWPHEQNAA